MIRWLLAAALATTPIAATAQSSLEARLQRVEDDLAIRRVLVDYAAFLDGRDYARYAALFTADAEWRNATASHKGQAAIRQMLEGTLGRAGGPNRSNFHIISNPQVDIDGDRATAASRYLFVMRGPDGRPVPSLAGVYHDDLVRQDGQWKIQRRVADDIMPTAEEWRKIIAAQQASK
jgi:ketosteroid isomerase-like protein